MTNADKTGHSFTCIEAARISQREDIGQVLKGKHGVSMEATPTVQILCAGRFLLKLLVKCCLCSRKGER